MPRLLVLLAVTACMPWTREPAALPRLPRGEAVSLLGDTLTPPPIAPATRERYEAQLRDAQAELARSPDSPDATIWVGRRLAYLGRYRDAIDVFSRGIERWPTDARFLRHRGHRYISIRELDRGIADLSRAAQLIDGKPDEVEPDGLPNARNMPIGTLHSNIWYHLGLAHYLKGDFDRAVPIYEREMREARNDDRRVSTAHWLYMALRRLGRDREAAAVLVPITRAMNVVENDTYHRLLLMYKGELPSDSLLVPGGGDRASVTDVTAAYGVANWHYYNGRRAEAERLLRQIVRGEQWGAFGYIAAEADLRRLGR
jgi:tetratricopeptide (TPR) repeat protein